MSLKTFVKISNVNNLSDARYCAGMYVDLLGFSLEPNDEYYVDPVKFKEITGWVSGVGFVGEFKTTHPDIILETIAQYEGIESVQIEEEAHLQMLMNASYQLILKKDVADNKDMERLLSLSASLGENGILLLVEAESNPDLVPDKELLNKLAEKCEVILGFGFDSENVEDTLDNTKIKGIAMKGGHEIKPGIKDFDELADILEVLEEAD
ncbi:phosphoribosylanthranilate isomerase [Pleomorphovibrio marinus]|uniref:phosphoribosylanthranilate isomerase n=1 Tax=Pleomorphovibrio marinus TaxID=2164132 RepID=UPI000E0A2C28|nr:phosphoribosylanthranilate isomerase [Pleomorphovibrio marinus]